MTRPIRIPRSAICNRATHPLTRTVLTGAAIARIEERMKNLPEATFYDKAMVFLGSRHKYICEGRSMNPTLKDGEVVLVDRGSRINVGDIVVARHPVEQDGEVVKRVARISDGGHYFLLGDNLEDSIDSRHYGAVTKEYIKGKVVARLS